MPRTLPHLLVLLACGTLLLAEVPPVPVPPENPITSQKRVLGKILFWDEQLSSDDTMACGTCHDPAHAGADGRVGIHPGFDEQFGTLDDVKGSPGMLRQDASGTPVPDPLFGLDKQVTRRAANPIIGVAFPPEVFWDGRADGTFIDPQTDEVSIASGATLENQAVNPPVSVVEMAHEDRDWDDVVAKLGVSLPLALATDLPADVSAVLALHPAYADLFQMAYGDPTITAERVIFALATHERSLVADQTPWDAFEAGDDHALTPAQQQGLTLFLNSNCSVCHAPPLFTDHSFRNIGLTPWQEDPGRMETTGLFEDRGKFKVPTLRNAGLKETFFHNGEFESVLEAVQFYQFIQVPPPDNVDPLLPIDFGDNDVLVADFIANGLLDPRVAAESFPFDHPTLHAGALPRLTFEDRTTLSWPALDGVQSYPVYRGNLADLVDGDLDGLPDVGYGDCLFEADPTDTVLVDPQLPEGPGAGFFYLKGVVDALGDERGLGATSAGLARQVATPCP